MNLQKQISKSEIAKGIKELYDFCGYDIEKTVLVKLSNMVMELWPSVSKKQFDMFIHNAELGEFGMIYKSPISFMVVFRAFKNDNKLESHTVVTKDTILK